MLQSEAIEDTAKPGLFAGVDLLVKRLCPLNVFRFGSNTDRFIANDLLTVKNRCYIGINPVIITVFTAVLNDTHPVIFGLDGIPQVFKCRRWHIRVTDKIVVFSEHFIARETTDFFKRGIESRDCTFQISGGNEFFFECNFVVSYG